MINGYPTEEELRNRITRQLSWRDPTDTVALLWRGYLTSLLEWGLIEVHVYDDLRALLPKVGIKELNEICLDEPISPEREAEIDEYLAQKK
jgi:hypothetical protein